MRLQSRVLATVLLTGMSGMAMANEMFESFENAPATRWDYIADTVMGGVSTGAAQFVQESSGSYVRLSGEVSTANNGGFIQVRRQLPSPLPAGTTGLRLKVRGNGSAYFVHLRTKGTRLPWQYYQASFPTTQGWTEIQLKLTDFVPSGRLMRTVPQATAITSVGIVAFGRDHSALVEVSEVDWY